jgi:hypothetical protein
MSARSGPWRLVTVNTAPERAKRLIGRMIEALKDRYDIEYLANCESKCLTPQFIFWIFLLTALLADIAEVLPKVTQYKPNVIVSSSLFSHEK